MRIFTSHGSGNCTHQVDSRAPLKWTGESSAKNGAITLAFAPREAPINILQPMSCGIVWEQAAPIVAAALTAAERATAPRLPSQ
jgi:hypothetical protein